MHRRNFFSLLAAASPLLAQDVYKQGPDSFRQDGVPKGKVSQFTFDKSKIFPGTTRDYWVYLPAQYKASEPACVMIFHDGGGMVREEGTGFKATVVMDNLIHKKEMPVTVGIFINPGVLPAPNANAMGRYNRSLEYDGLGDKHARFLIEEILPEVRKVANLSANPDHYALMGSSSGGIAAFNAAWNRPDQFRRVMSFIGSFTNLRGAQILPSLIRKNEPKPLRVYLQDGSNDNDIYSGSWWIANQDMARSLEWSGYESTFVKGTEAHNSKHGSAVLPDAMRLLWKDFPKPVAVGKNVGDKHWLNDGIIAGEDWQVVSTGHKFTEGPAVDKAGQVYFTDIPNNRIHKIDLAGNVTVFKEDSGGCNGLMFGPDGLLYACQNRRRRIVAYAADGSEKAIAEDVGSNDLAITAKGEIYFTDPGAKKVWYIDVKGAKRVVHEGIEFPNGIILSPDQTLLLVADMRNKWVWSFAIQPDGSLANGEPFHHLETADDNGQSGADGMTIDTTGHLYVATSLGVQICDQPGRVVAILNKPQLGPLANLVFGGPNLDTLYATAGDKVFKRRINRKGINAWTVVKPPMPRL